MTPESSVPAQGGDNLPTTARDRRELTTAGAFNHVAYATSHNKELNIATLWRVMWEWRWLILSTLAVGLAGAIILTLLSTPLYRSTTIIELNPPRVEVSTNERAGQATSRDQQFIGTQLGLLRSRALALRVVQDLNLAANPAVVAPGQNRKTAEDSATSVVAGSIRADLVPQSRLVSIMAISTDPGIAASIANGTAEAYVNSTLERQYQASSFARDFLQRQIASVRRELEGSERQLVTYAQQERLISTSSVEKGSGGDDGGSLAADSLVSMNSALTTAQAKRFAAEQKYRESLGSAPTMEVDERTSGLRSQVASLTAEYNLKLNTFKPDYPEMVRLKSQIDSLRSSIGSEAATTRASRSNTLRQDFLASRAEESKLQQRVSELSGDVLELRGRNIRYTILKRDVDTNRSLYDALLQRYKEIGVAGGIGEASASVVDRARPAGRPYSPRLAFNLLLGAALGFLAGFGAALVMEFVNDTIKSPDDVRDKLQLPFLGGVPVSRGTPIEDLADSGTAVAEAYFSLASAIQYISETGVPRTLLVTSTRPAEGKSTSAWGLAQNLTKLGKSVLLIDADMRRPAFVTGAEDNAGLSNLLTGSGSLMDMVLKTETPRLWIMPSGPIPPSPPELLALPRFLQVLEEAQEHFDAIVIDGPPILGLADAPLIASVVKATVMVVESGRTRTRAAIEAHNRLRAANAHIVGAVLTRYKAQSGYGYGYGYGDQSYTYKVDDKRRRKIALTLARGD